MTGPSFCDIGVDTSDLPVYCYCGCSHCCSSTTKLSSSANIGLKRARPLKLKQQSRSCSLLVIEKPGVKRNETDDKNVPSTHRNTTELYNHVIGELEDEPRQDRFLSSLTGHVSHVRPDSDKCTICEMSFNSHLELCKHSAVHSNRRYFYCAVCNASFVKKDSLNIHIRKHSGERPFECDICGATFSRRFTLTNHRVLHSGERNHVCTACGKSFPTRGALTAHEKSSHSRSSSSQVTKRRLKDFTPSVCDQCGKVYSNAANLLIHKRTHTGRRPFLCPLCGLAFGKKYSLQCHMRRHSNDRPFKCGECGAAFFRKSTLNTHQRRHSGEKPYECKLCGRGFIQNSSLKYHIKHHDHSQTSPPLDSQSTNEVS